MSPMSHFNSSAIKQANRAESNAPAIPMTRFFSKPLTFAATYVMTSSENLYGPRSKDGASGLTEEELNQQLIDAQAGTGEITVSMLWSTADDLDLHIITPSGSEIYYGNKTVDGGTLDVDRQVNSDELVSSPIENIFFQSPMTE